MRTINGSWIDFYLQYVDAKAPDYPRVWAKWAAIAGIAATLKRHVFAVMPNGGWKLYPTTYVVLVGRPGLGKGLAMNDVMPIVKDAKVANIISGKLTMPYVLDLMSKGFSTVPGTIDHTCFMWSSELSVFMNAYKDTIEVLTDLWDTLDHPFVYGTMAHSQKRIPSPTLSLLGGSAPEWLAKAVPADAVGGGFTRRVNFVFAANKEPGTPHNGFDLIQSYRELVNNLQHISSLHGQLKFSKGLVAKIEDYANAAEPDEFDDAATAGYTTTKPAHAVKLSMIRAVSHRDSMEIIEDDFDWATKLVEDAAEGMRKVFRSIGSGNLVAACDKLLRYLESRMAAAQTNPQVIGKATRNEIMSILWKDISNTQELDMIIDMLMQAGLVCKRTQGRTEAYEILPKAGKSKGVTP